MAKKKQPAKKECVGAGVEITNSNRAEESLRESKERYQRITEGLTDYLYTVRLQDGQVVETVHGQACEVVTGYTREEFADNPNLWISMVVAEERDQVSERIQRILAGDNIPPIEHRIIRKDGQVRWVRDTPILQFDARRKLVSYDGVIKDITEHRKAYETLQKSEEKYRLLVENINDVFYTLDTQGNISYASPVVERFTLYKVSDLIGKPFIPLIYPDDLPGLLESFGRLASDQLEPWEFRVLDKDGRIIFVRSSSRPIYEGGQVVGFAALMTDITERKKTADALARSEEGYRTILEQMQDSYYEVDLAGNYTFVSESAGHSLGYSREELLGQNYRLTTIEEDTSSIFAAFNQVYRTGKPNKGFLHRIRHRDGSTIFSEVSVDLKRNEQGEVAGFKCVSRDVTQRRQMEQELRESEEQLRATLENAPDGIYMNDFEGNFLYGNHRCEEIIGFKREELIGKNFLELNILPEDSLARAAEILQDNINGKSTGPDELELVSKDGRHVPVEINTSIVQRAGKKVVLAFVRDVTERKKIESALRESEEHYRLLAEHTTDAVWLMDMNLHTTYHSPSAIKRRGFTPQEIMEMSLEQNLTPESLKLALELFIKELPKIEADPGYNPVYSLELEYYRKDGTTIWSESKFSIIRDPNGKPVSILAESRDITDRKKAEDAVRESEMRFKSIIEHITDIFYMMDSNHKILYVSPQIEQVLGYTMEEVRDNWRNYLTDNPVNLAGHEKTQLAFTTGEKQAPYVQELMHRDGTKRLAEMNESPLKNDEGQVIGMVGAARDITERKRVESALKESEEKYRLLVENAQEAIVIVVDGTVTFANRRTSDITGYSQEEFVSRPYIEFVHPDDRQALSERYFRRLSGIDVPNPYTFRCVWKSGEIKWTEVSAALITWEGRPATLNFMTDISDRKRLEEEQQRVAKLESVGVLAGGIAHDFNNILTAILGNISLARMEAAPGNAIQESLEQAEKASIRAKDLTQQLLTFSKGGTPVRKLASLTELLRDTAGFALRGSNVKCNFSIPANLWHAEIDAGQVSQVIHNLVINGQQAMPSGGDIEMRAENISLSEKQKLGRGLPLKAGNYIRIAITDHGSGIPRDHLEKIFDPFFTTKQKGSGLGLATSFSIARNHGGHLSVESELGSGSTFYLYLPASLETSAPKQAKKEAMKPAGKARILVMDDEQGVREVAGRMLKHLGYQDIAFAAGGAEAIKLYKAAMKAGNPFTVAILDLTIAGGMGGKEAVKKLLKIDPAVKAIVSSGYTDDSVMSKYRGYGFSGMAAKPYTLEQLGKALHDVIG